ncbi:hypothetical protein HZS_4753 [Henneguya salminicola]|nr:hypothetical protein HZS_4753 [Henneguya salminicola]
MLEDFSNYENPQKEYDDYLEHVEDIIYNLVNGIDVEYTNKEINEFKKENEAIIKKNYSKLSAIDSQILKQINKDNDIQVKNVRDSQKELSDNLKKAKNDRKTLIDQLMVSSASASEIILAQQHKKIHQNNPEEIRQEVVDIEIPLYTYQPQNIHILGPSIPEVLDEFLMFAIFCFILVERDFPNWILWKRQGVLILVSILN